MKELTKAEEQVMQILWKIKKGFVNDIMDQIPGPKPAYNTISTIVRILEQKGFVDHKAYGRTHEYFPLLNKKEYMQAYLNQFVGNYFDHSYRSLASFFMKDENLSLKEMEDLKKIMEEAINKKKK
jgi:BlaI family penicillinase repressor